MSYQVRLSVFEGAFDLLFHLIEQEEVDIWDIPVARITEQYLEYLTSIDELDLESAGEFLVMAATLLAIKARMLLPTPPTEADEEGGEATDPRAELVTRLLEYRRYREAAAVLADLAAGRDRLHPRGWTHCPDWSQPRFSRPVGEATVGDLWRAMRDVLNAYQPPPPTVAIPRRLVTIEGCIKHIEQAVQARPFCLFRHLLSETPTRQDVVVTFLALLELIHRGSLHAEQSETFGPIEISRKQGEGRA